MRALAEGGADVRAVDEQGFSALLNAVKVGACCAHLCSFSGIFEYKYIVLSSPRPFHHHHGWSKRIASPIAFDPLREPWSIKQ